MFLFKIGKQRQRHNLTLKLHKLTYSDASKLQNGQYFKITVMRGSQKFDFTTCPAKKGQIKCNKQSHTFSMTLFYDEQNKKYLQKQIQIEGEIMNSLDETERQLGNSVLDITQYMRDAIIDKFVLQVQLSDQKKRVCKVKFHVLIEKIEEDAKDDIRSVNTNERYQSSKEVSENGDSKKPVKQFTKNYKFGQITASETSSQKSANVHMIKPPKSVKVQQKLKSQKDKYLSQQTILKSNQQQFNSNQEISEFIKSSKTPIKNKPAKTPPKSTKQQRDKIQTKKPVTQQLQQQESPQLKLYMCQQKLKQSDKRLQIAKKKIQDQNQIINKMLEEQNKAQNSTQMIKSMNQIQSLKAQLYKANLKISQLQAQNRHLQSNQKQNLKLIDTKSKQAAYYKQQLEKTKLAFGRLMQRCFQANDFDLMAVIQEELNDI